MEGKENRYRLGINKRGKKVGRGERWEGGGVRGGREKGRGGKG